MNALFLCVLSHSDMSHILNCWSVNDKTTYSTAIAVTFHENICVLHRTTGFAYHKSSYTMICRYTALNSFYPRLIAVSTHFFHSAALYRQIVNVSLISAASGQRVVTDSHTSGRHSSAVGKALPSLNTVLRILCVQTTSCLYI
jgi:hypothetical protein